ncbi:MAG: flippase-like domain-containing protein, partial [Nitrospirae bacterium]|nr:flippase-like domain-containing protein [Nitrospirota bacterium]
EKIFELVRSFSEGLQIIKDRRGFLATVALSVLIWAMFVFTYYPLYLAFDIAAELPLISSLVILCLTVAIFITVAPTPGFLGSYHLGCVTALHGIFGVEKAVALSYGIVAWIVGMGTTVLIGAIFAVKENISIGKISAGKDL